MLIRIQSTRSRRARASVALVLSVLLSLVAGCGRTSPARRPSAGDSGPNATVVRVVDGDTVVVSLAGNDGHEAHEEKVRLIGIDTPETKKPNTPVQCFGEQASARLHDLLPDTTPVRLERDAEERDHYGRLLAYLYRTNDGLFVNLSLAADGYAVPLTIAPNVGHSDEFGAAAADARRRGKGLWSACPEPRPPI